MTTTIILSSGAFGEETFEYDTQDELLAGVARLLESCKKQIRKDGIEREIRVRIEP